MFSLRLMWSVSLTGGTHMPLQRLNIMHSTLRRGLSAACLLLVVAQPAQALVVSSQYFSTTSDFSGYYAPFGVPAHAFWNISQTTDPLAVVVIDLTVTGSVTLVEANPWQFPIGWTPTLSVSLAANAPGFTPVSSFDVAGTFQMIAPPTLPGNSHYGTPETLHFTAHFTGIISGPALADYTGGGTTYFNSTAHLFPIEQYGYYSGTVTHTARVSFNAPRGRRGVGAAGTGAGPVVRCAPENQGALKCAGCGSLPG